MTFQRRMSGLPLRDVRLTDRFWTGWQAVLRDTMLEAQYQQLLATGRLRNFENAAKASPQGSGSGGPALCDQSVGTASAEEGGYTGYYFNDSDVYKWCEACAYALASGPLEPIRERLESVISLIAAAQMEDGYLSTFFQIRHPDLRWRNLGSMHEMYCAGHLFEAAAAVFECTGDRKLLDVAIRLADHLCDQFGPKKRKGYCGHEEVELALLRLAETTGHSRYADLARWMVEQRGTRPSPFEAELDDSEATKLSPWARKLFCDGDAYSGEYLQDHAPVRDHTAVVGHAVRAMYLYMAATEMSDGDDGLSVALEGIWNNLTRKRMYITGGIGPSGENEGFTRDFDLPNLTAYAETCASCGVVFWGRRLLEWTGNSEFADVMERALYNGALSGVSLDGSRYFYANPLESRGEHERSPWFACACCPPNIARLIGSVGRYMISSSPEGIWIHIPAGFEAKTLVQGQPVMIVCESDYPWSGRITVRVEPETPVAFELRLRIPEWADEVETELPGLEEASEWEHGYAVFRKTWQKGDRLTVDFGMEPKWMECHPQVRDNLGRVALTRGPLVYCAERHDLGFAPQLLAVDTEAPVGIADLHSLGGITSLQTEGFADSEEFVDDLYAAEGSIASEPVTASFVPYFAWCNRGPNEMQVWVRRA